MMGQDEMATLRIHTKHGEMEVTIFTHPEHNGPFVTVRDERGKWLHPSNTVTDVEFDLSFWSHVRDLQVYLDSPRAFGAVLKAAFDATRKAEREVYRVDA